MFLREVRPHYPTLQEALCVSNFPAAFFHYMQQHPTRKRPFCLARVMSFPYGANKVAMLPVVRLCRW